ncbi:MAG: SRPBCC domain-containing protein [Prolixibacteraceae bacterium]|nr:SRPBCC domain-containing protein [Prolixibacteraceae bacterium]
MENDKFVLEQIYSAPVETVWKAITSKEEMKQWYFNFKEFVPEVGFEFQFWGGPDESRQYLHLCKITEVFQLQKLAYSWRYDGYEGDTLVTFELVSLGNLTKLKLTHEGLGTFPVTNPDFAKENFVEGWNWIIGTSLKEFLENKSHH